MEPVPKLPDDLLPVPRKQETSATRRHKNNPPLQVTSLLNDYAFATARFLAYTY